MPAKGARRATVPNSTFFKRTGSLRPAPFLPFYKYAKILAELKPPPGFWMKVCHPPAWHHFLRGDYLSGGSRCSLGEDQAPSKKRGKKKIFPCANFLFPFFVVSWRLQHDVSTEKQKFAKYATPKPLQILTQCGTCFSPA